MSRREFELEWDRGKQYLFKSIFTEGPALSPIPEYPEQIRGEPVLTRDRDPSPPPPLIIERVPRRRDDDEPEEFYVKLERKMIKYYKLLFNLKRNSDSSSTEFDEEIYGCNPYDYDESDLDKAFIGDQSKESIIIEEELVEKENSNSYEDIDEEIEEDQLRGSRVVTSTYIVGEGEDHEEDNGRQRQDESAESEHSLILSSNVTRKHREDGRDSRDADTLQNLRVDEDWTVSSFQLEAGTRFEEMLDDDDDEHGDDDGITTNHQLEAGTRTEEMLDDDDENGDDERPEAMLDGDDEHEEVEDNTLDNNNIIHKTIETIEDEENSDHYETIDIEEINIGDVEMRRQEITPQRSSPMITERSPSPIIPSFRKHLDISHQSIELRLSQKDQSSIENNYYNVSHPRTSTPRKSRKRASENIDAVPAKIRHVGVQTSREFLIDVDTQTEYFCKNVSVQANLDKAVKKRVAPRWRR